MPWARASALSGRVRTEAELSVCHGVIVLGEGLVIHQCILGEDADSFADVEVQTCLILGLLHVVLAVRLIHVVTCLHVDTAVLWQLCQWGNDQAIYTLCLVANLLVRAAIFGIGIVEVGDALGKCLAGRVDVLRTNSPSVFLVFEREGVAVLVEAANLVGMSNLFGGTRSYARGWSATVSVQLPFLA